MEHKIQFTGFIHLERLQKSVILQPASPRKPPPKPHPSRAKQ